MFAGATIRIWLPTARLKHGVKERAAAIGPVEAGAALSVGGLLQIVEQLEIVDCDGYALCELSD